MSTKLFNSATAASNRAEEEEAIETIAVPNGNEEENAAVSSTDSESNVSSDAAAAHDAGKGTTNRFVAKCGVFTAVGALAVAIGGAASVHFAGRPTKNFSSSKQVALASGEIKIKGFTYVGGGKCKDGPADGGNLYDYVSYDDVADAEACANLCSVCPGGGQTDTNNAEIVLRGFQLIIDSLYGDCFCLVDDGAELSLSLCEGSYDTSYDEYEGGSGEIESSTGGAVGEVGECWKVNSKSSKSSKRGSKGGKRG